MNHKHNHIVLALYKQDRSIADIFKETGIPKVSIFNILKRGGVIRSVKEGLAIAKAKGKIYHKDQMKEDLLNDGRKLAELYSKMPLHQIEKTFHIKRSRISQALNKFGVVKDWRRRAVLSSLRKREAKLPRELFDRAWLCEKYEREQLSVGKVAELLSCSISPVRRMLKKFGIEIRRISKSEPVTSRGQIISYLEPGKCPKKPITFRSVLECSYAILLDSDDDVISWDYETAFLIYRDGFTGKERKYICDFKVARKNLIEHVEVKPLRLQIPTDRYLYAPNVLQNWRFISEAEIKKATVLFSKRRWPIKFPEKMIRNVKRFCVWSTRRDLVVPGGHRIMSCRRTHGWCWRYRIINDLVTDNKTIKMRYARPSNVQDGREISLDLQEILGFIKKDGSLSGVARKLGVCVGTITKFLEDRSFVVRWGGASSRHNEIRLATRLIWPDRQMDPRRTERRRVDHFWDDRDWLINHYTRQEMSTRQIGKIVGVSGRLILKKLRKHKISTRSNGRGRVPSP